MIVYLVIFSLSQFRSSYQHNNGDIMFLSSRRRTRYILGVFNGSWKLNLSHKHLEWLISFLTNKTTKKVKECKCIFDKGGKCLQRNGKRKVWKKYVTSTDKPLKSYWLNENNKKKVFTKFSYQSRWGLINL